MRLGNITLRDYILNPAYRKAVDSIDYEKDTVHYKKWVKRIEVTTPSLHQKWFTFKVRLFLSQQFADDEVIMIGLAVYFMQFFYKEFDEKHIPAMFEKVLKFDAWGAMQAAQKFWKEYETIKLTESSLNYEPTAEEKQAGIDKLNVFGEWGTVDGLALRLHLTHSQILDLPYSDCFLMLKKDSEKQKFEKKYFDVIKNKK